MVLMPSIVFLIATATPAAEPPALKACAVPYSSLDADAIPGVRSGIERHFPPGTREYLGKRESFYVMSAPGHSTLSLDGDARFRCTKTGLDILYHRAAMRVVYPRGSAVVRETAARRYFVKPGEPLPRDVRAGLRAGTIRLNKTL